MDTKMIAVGMAAVIVIASVAVFVLSEDVEAWPGHDGLEIFGNANGDWSVDVDDLAYIQAIIDGEEEPNKFADANRDGKIDERDIAHVQALIDGDAEFIWILDGNGVPVKIGLPVERIGVEYLANAELMNILGVSDKVVAVDAAAYIMKDFYFPGKNFTDGQMGQMHSNPNFETIFDMNLDVLFTFSPDTDTKVENLPGTDVVFLGLYWPNVIDPQDSRFMQGVVKAGYILDAVDRANDYKDWLEGLVERLDNVTSGISEEDRPSVLMTSHNRYFGFNGEENMEASIYTKIDPLSQACILAGGNPIAQNIDNWVGAGGVYGTTVTVEWILEQEPEFIFAHSVRYTYSGLTREPAYGYDWDDISNYTAAVDDMLSRSALGTIPAYQNGNVYITAGDFRNNAMGGILGAVYLAKILHPALFADLDPVAIHQEFVSDWMGLDYNLSTNGVFIAPAI